IAMGLPIVTALFGLGTGLGLIALFTHVVDTPDFSSELAAMIGLGVGIDYALFIVTRFREAYSTPGPTFGDVRESVVQAMDTAGRAVLFAGCTVVIALLGMMLLGVDFLYGVAISASIGVLLVMLGSLTLLPALLTFAGGRLVRPGRRARKRGAQATDARQGRTWLRWSGFVQRHSWSIGTASLLVMLVIAAPATALRLGSSDAGNDPVHTTTYKAYQLLAEGFGKGFNGPLLVVAKVPNTRGQAAAQGAQTITPPSASGRAAVEELRIAIARGTGVAAVAPAKFNPAGNVATISVYPTSSPQEYKTTQLVGRLRSQTIPPVAAQTGMQVYVGGITAGSVDFAEVLGKKLPLFIGVVVLLSALLLTVVFRSLAIPLQAAVMNLLSIGASLGISVGVFRWGWVGGLMGVNGGPIESFIPVMLFAIVFGLSMDYEVFLVARIHEQWARKGDSRRAVGEGLALTGRVITAAAAIMICVFLSFMLGENRVIKEFGLSLASAVFLDALIVRCLLLPAVLNILGDVTWKIPTWLDRILPRLNIERDATQPGRRSPARDVRFRGEAGAGRHAWGDRELRRVRGGLLAALLCTAAAAGSPSAAVASPAVNAGRSVLLLFVAPGPSVYGQGADDAIERQLSSIPTLSTGILSATQGTYKADQLLLDVSQGARVAYSAYSPTNPPSLDSLAFGPPPSARVPSWPATLRRAHAAPQLLEPGLLATSIP